MVRRAPASLMVLALAAGVLASCSTSSGGSSSPKAPAITKAAPFTGHGSTDAAYVLGATKGEKLMLVDSGDHIVAEGSADNLGSFEVPDVKPGSGYTFRSKSGKAVYGTKPFMVMSTSYVPPTSLYTSQHLHEGMNYIRMRDGVYINATVRLPAGKTLADGPFPTVIEYSGYQTAAPGNLLKALLNSLKTHKAPTGALLPNTATAVGSVLAPLLGFASVSVQMRGTGCSGGAFDLFGADTIMDGYDVVETVAHQPWVAHHKVGMVGISFSGFSQLFVAGTRPPDLAAVAPLSTTNDFYATGYPGGIFNDGFAYQWLLGRFASAEPATAKPSGALPYATAEVQMGDKQCIADQALHGQAQQIVNYLKEASYRVPSLYDVRTSAEWAKKIDVPVYIAGAFQDEETGGQWPVLISDMKNDPHVFATVINGTHSDSLNPAIISRWLEFLQIFVADEVPTTPPIVASLGGMLYQAVANASSQPIAPLRFTTAKTVAQARALFEKDTPRVRVLFDNGGSPKYPAGAMGPEFEEDYNAWPPPPGRVTRFYLGASGALTSKKGAAASVAFRPDPSARPADDLPSGNAWSDLPPYDWAPVTGSSGIGFISAPLSHDVMVVGPAALDLWVKSSASDTDLQATVSEVRPDGKEMFINTGDLRASFRKLDTAASTALHPVPLYTKSSASPMPKGKYVEVQIPINPFAYVFRKGSRIRVTVEAPGGDRPSWQFDTPKTGGKVVDTVSLGGSRPSSLLLDVIPGATAPDPQPVCPSLRGQPCRSYVAAGNGG